MKLALFIFTIVLCLFSLFGCGPSEQAIQIALAQTQTAMATNTHTPEPTATSTPEPTFTPTSTSTLTPTPTSTYTLTPTPDLRIITTDPKDLMLSKDDLPHEAKYFLPNSSWISPHRNYEIISSWGREEGMIYLEETGRIDGWWVYYKRGTSTVRAPEEIFHNIIQYKSAEGAYLTLTKYSRRNLSPEYDLVNIDIIIGDAAFVYQYKIMQPNGQYHIYYTIETQFRNYVSIVAGWGWEKEFDLDYLIKIAEIAMEKLMAAPLGNW